MHRYKLSIERIPDWSLNYLVNEEVMGLIAHEEVLIAEFLQPWIDKANKIGGYVVVSQVDSDQDRYFTMTPAYGLPCNVVDCYVFVGK